IELHAHHRPTVAQVTLRCERRCDPLPVASLPCLGEARHGARCRVLDSRRRRWFHPHLVEASERLVLAIEVEELDASDEAVGTEGPELNEPALEGADAD